MASQAIWHAENARNQRNSALYEDIIRTVFDGVTQVGCGHHLMFASGPLVDEFPSADHLIFDHGVAEKLWGPSFREALMLLACEPAETRDALLSKLFYEGLPSS